ncbi:unnamed protein product [Acanthoscelides obtectus]|uniref:Uncharacterized protein n=1 Tax=Acanthoscelides obtectus TaxID=200917 RepID=A0A9P0PLM4_ACAOB|nr:unnamed protein product [Acanthoscelides obtectus]CAK1677955.1 hypothetical protein AOBTE_LOCUS31674 [Acanthoscelides obtectus]
MYTANKMKLLNVCIVILSFVLTYASVNGIPLPQNEEAVGVFGREQNLMQLRGIINIPCKEGYVKIRGKCRPIHASAVHEYGGNEVESIIHVPCKEGYVYIQGKCREIVGNTRRGARLLSKMY